jgi:hypothetical protein
VWGEHVFGARGQIVFSPAYRSQKKVRKGDGEPGFGRDPKASSLLEPKRLRSIFDRLDLQVYL